MILHVFCVYSSQWQTRKSDKKTDNGVPRQMKEDKKRRPPIISGVFWLGLGLIMLAGQQGYVPSLELHHLWPILIILVGLGVIVGAMKRSHGTSEDS